MDAITAYQLTSMMEGVVLRGTGKGINLPVPIAGKTGTTNDAKDVWFIGYSSTIVAGCYIGYDQPQGLGDVSGGGFCGPVFERFMGVAINKYGGTKFKVPPGGYFVKIDRFTGAKLPDNATGDHVVSEYFREGEEPVFGLVRWSTAVSRWARTCPCSPMARAATRGRRRSPQPPVKPR